MNKIDNVSNPSFLSMQGGSSVSNRFVFIVKVTLLFLAAAYVAHQTGAYNQFRDWLTRRGFFSQSNRNQTPGRIFGGTNMPSSSSQSASLSTSSRPSKPKGNPKPWPEAPETKLCSDQTLAGLVPISELQSGEDGISLLNETREFFALVQQESNLDRADKVGKIPQVEPLPNPNEWLEFQVTTPANLFASPTIKQVRLDVEAAFIGGHRVEFASCAGRKPQMDDRHISETIDVTGYPTMGLVGVFAGYKDGFGFKDSGDIVAEFIQESIVEYFTSELRSLQSEDESIISDELRYARIICALKNSIIKIDEAYLRYGQWTHMEGYGYRFAAPGSGSAVVIAIVVDDQIITANLGDSRAILVRDGNAFPLSIDATLTNETCRSKIIALGATPDHNGRLESFHDRRLLKAAGIGDHRQRPNRVRKCVLNEPEMSIIHYVSGDRLVVASAGVWEVVSSNRAAGIVSRTSAEGDAVPDRVDRASALANLALRNRGQQENSTVAVVSF